MEYTPDQSRSRRHASQSRASRGTSALARARSQSVDRFEEVRDHVVASAVTAEPDISNFLK